MATAALPFPGRATSRPLASCSSGCWAGDACHLHPPEPALGRRRGLALPALDAARHPRPLISRWAICVLFNRGTAARASHCFSGPGGAWARHLVVRHGHPAGWGGCSAAGAV